MVVNYVCVKVCLSVIYPEALIELAMGFELGGFGYTKITKFRFFKNLFLILIVIYDINWQRLRV